MAASEVLPADVVHAAKKGFPMPPEFTRGCEQLLRKGCLAEQMQWSGATIDEALLLAAEDAAFRFQVTGLEIWMRLFCRNEAPDRVGDRLQELAS
jgi:hypothetical protein